jgi:hypothetical protein
VWVPSCWVGHRKALHKRVAEKQQKLLSEFEKGAAERRTKAAEKFAEQYKASIKTQAAKKEEASKKAQSSDSVIYKPKYPQSNKNNESVPLPATERQYWEEWGKSYEQRRHSQSTAAHPRHVKSDAEHYEAACSSHTDVGVSNAANWEEWGRNYERRRGARSVAEVERETSDRDSQASSTTQRRCLYEQPTCRC